MPPPPMIHDIAQPRLRSQRLLGPGFAKPGDVVAWLGAVQAQDYAGAKWALGQRLRGATDEDVERAFTTGAVLRTHVLRPTWHFVTPADIRWMLALTAPRVHAANAHMYRKLELDAATFRRSGAVLEKALAGGRQLTRDELRPMLEKAGVATAGEFRMSYVMMRAELDGVVCSGARRGKQFTYALLDERAPQAARLARDEALAALAHRFFTSRGPASVQDFAKWSGLTVADAGRGLADVKGALRGDVLNGREYWKSAKAQTRSHPTPSAHLLSIYDEYISGYKDRSAMVDPKHVAPLRALGNALTSIVVVDGQVVGTWKRTVRTDTVAIETSLFTRLTSPGKKAVAAAARRYANFLGLSVYEV